MYPADADADADADAGRSRSLRSLGSAIRKFAERETEPVGRCSVECGRKIGLGTGLRVVIMRGGRSRASLSA